jgi:alpha-beta hydrolase superfamily lysophospholipase
MTPIEPVSLRIPLVGFEGFGPSPAVSAWLFAPPALDPGEPQILAFCVPGGGYGKKYFHIEAPGVDGYSMGRHFAARGAIAVAIDWLGSGDSARADDAERITWQSLIRAHHAVMSHLLRHLALGTLAPEIPALPRLTAIGIGHSLGGMLVSLQQALHGSFTRIAVLGWSNLGLNLEPAALVPILDETGKYARGHALLRRAFHLPDVPAAVLASEAERENLPVSLTLAAQFADREAIRRIAAGITVPVFVGFGEQDTSPAPHDEAGCYTGSSDITLFLVPGSAHCHNFARTRMMLWDRILLWLGSQTAGSGAFAG